MQAAHRREHGVKVPVAMTVGSSAGLEEKVLRSVASAASGASMIHGLVTK